MQNAQSNRKPENVHSFQILGDSGWLWPGMAAMYESLCGNCVDEVELSLV
jgi:hypothetical protein